MTTWPVLQSLAPDEVGQLLRRGHRRRFRRSEIVFDTGDLADSLHLLDRGRVAVRVTTPAGHQAIVGVLGPGAAFGGLGPAAHPSGRAVTFTALQECATIVLHRREFVQLRREAGIDQFLLQSLIEEVNQLSEQLLEVLYVPAPMRVLRRVLDLGEEFDGVITMTQQDIALMSGTTRATVNETLRGFERDGAIRIGRARIDLVDRGHLVRQWELATA